MNIFRDEKGKLQPYVQVRRQGAPPLIEVIDRNPEAVAAYPLTRFGMDQHNKLVLLSPGDDPIKGEVVMGGAYSLYTRIWFGVSPPFGSEPGYCAVVGEEFDKSFAPKQRRLFQLDEGVIIEGDPAMALLPEMMEAVCALKDIYMPSDRNPLGGGDNRIWIDPTNEQFYRDLLDSWWGIASYADELSEDLLKARYPFFASTERVGSVVVAPFAATTGGFADYAIKTVDSLFARGLLHHHKCCSVWKDGQYRTPHKALGLACVALQTYRWSEIYEDQRDFDGYDEEKPPQALLDAKVEEEERFVAMIHACSDPVLRREIEKKGTKGFRELFTPIKEGV
jgi:hypothetical protein